MGFSRPRTNNGYDDSTTYLKDNTDELRVKNMKLDDHSFKKR